MTLARSLGTTPFVLYGSAAVVVLVFLYLGSRKEGTLARDAAQGAARAIVGTATDAIAGAAVGIGEVFGIPPTDPDRCAAALAAREFWNSSLYCPAGTFFGSWFGNRPAPAAAPAIPAQYDSPGGATGSW